MHLHGSSLRLGVWVRNFANYYPRALKPDIALHPCSRWNCRPHWEPRRSVSLNAPLLFCSIYSRNRGIEIVMVRLQGDFAKPPEKRFNYKHCFDALFRVRTPSSPALLACAPIAAPLQALVQEAMTYAGKRSGALADFSVWRLRPFPRRRLHFFWWNEC